MTRTDSQSAIMIDSRKEIHHMLVIVKRFPRSHYHNMTQPILLLIQITLHIQHLGHHFSTCQVAFLFCQTTGTKGTGHIAAYL